MKTHEPGQPLELPSLGAATPPAPGGAARRPRRPPPRRAAPPPPPTLNVAPPARNVEKMER